MKNNVIILSLFLSSSLFAQSSMYNGTSGLIEVPNARIQKDFNGTVFYSNDNPYSHYGLAFSVLPNVEVNAHITEIKDSNDGKDKVINAKILLFHEGDISPSIVFGLDDFWGGLDYTSKYIAMSKKIGYFDFTLGYAIGRLAGSKDLQNFDGSAYKYLKRTSISDGDIFAGLEFYASKKLRLLLEHSAINYDLNKNKPKKSSKTNVNFGLNYNLYKNLNAKISFNRGNQFSFGLKYDFDMLNNQKNFDKKNIKTYEDNLTKNLVDNNFSNINMIENEDSLWISAQNDSSYYDIDSLLKATDSVVNSKNKREYDYVYLDLNKQNKKVLKINTKEFEKYKEKDVSSTYMKKALIVENDKNKLYEEFLNSKKIKKYKEVNKKSFYYNIQPKMRNYLVNNNHKPLYTKAQIDFNAGYKVSKNLDLKTTISLPILSTMDDLDTSDRYDRYEKPFLDKLNLSYSKNFENQHYLNLDAGVLNQKYIGTNIEYQKSFFDDKFALSLQYQNVNRRYENKIFDTYGKNHDAKFLNLYYQLSKEKNTHIGLKVGEFLNKDRGHRVDLARSYKKIIIGAYVTRTKDGSKKYNSKGFYIKVPLGKKYFNSAKKLASVSFDSLSKDNSADFVDFDNSLFNRLSNENNLQLIKKSINILRND